jgi:hypothetical protein
MHIFFPSRLSKFDYPEILDFLHRPVQRLEKELTLL